VHTGNPIRTKVIETPRMRRDRLGLLVVGGSGGAHSLNAAMVEGAGLMLDLLRTVDLLHQTGPTDAPAMRAGYAQLGLTVGSSRSSTTWARRTRARTPSSRARAR
jgi:UDP-N-acetylglucosamine:LPS N-acetylglucosamine transferase